MAGSRPSKRAKHTHSKQGGAGDALLPPPTSISSSVSTSTSTNNFDTFTCFPRLPPELRLAIWSMTVEARTIVARTSLKENGKLVKNKYSIRSKTPAGLHVSKESRAELLNVYQLWMSTKRMLRYSQGFYFNPLMDTLYFADSFDYLNRVPWWSRWYSKLQSYSHIPTPGVSTKNRTPQIKSIAIDMVYWSGPFPKEFLATVEDVTCIVHRDPGCCLPPGALDLLDPIRNSRPPFWSHTQLANKLLTGIIGSNFGTTDPLFLAVHQKLASAKTHVRFCDGNLVTRGELDLLPTENSYSLEQHWAAAGSGTPASKSNNQPAFWTAIKNQSTANAGHVVGSGEVDKCQAFCQHEFCQHQFCQLRGSDE